MDSRRSMGHTFGAMGESFADLEAAPELAPSALVPQAEQLIHGARLLVVQGDPVLTDGLVQHLRALGCAVGVTDAAGRSLPRLDFLDPQVVLFDPAEAGEEARVLERLAANPRLRWATVLEEFSWEAIWPPFASAPDLVALGERVAPLTEPDRQLRLLAAGSDAFTAPFEQIGPARVLRALAGVSGDVLRLIVRAGAARATVELCGELVVGATFRDHPGGPVRTGVTALASVLALTQGQAEVVRSELATAMTLMTPVSLALEAAQVELVQPAAVVTEETRQRELDELIAASRATARSSIDDHPIFDLGEEEVTAKGASWEEQTEQSAAGHAAPATAGGDDDTTQRIALASEEVGGREARSDAASHRPASSRPPRPKSGAVPLRATPPPPPIPEPGPASSAPAPEATSAPAPHELPTPAVPVPLEALTEPPSTEPAPPPPVTSRPPPAPPHADAAGAHPAVEVGSSGKGAWIGAGVLLAVAAVVGGALAMQGGEPGSVAPRGRGAAPPAPAEEPESLGAPSGSQAAVASTRAEPPVQTDGEPTPAEAADEVALEERGADPEDERAADERAADERAEELREATGAQPASEQPTDATDVASLPLPPAPAVFTPQDVQGGADRARADALLAAAADARVSERLRYLYAAARADRRNPHVAEALARHFLDTRGPAAAEPWAREAVRLRRRRARYRVLLGDVLRAAGDREGARRAYEEAALRGDDGEARARLSELSP